MASMPFSARPRISGRDILPIVLVGVAVGGVIVATSLLADRSTGGTASAITLGAVGRALAMGIGFALVLAGLQGRAGEITPRRALIAWAQLTIIVAVVLLASGRLAAGASSLRFAIFVIASLGASLLLSIVRRRPS